MRATIIAATNSSPIVSGSKTAHSAPASFIPAPSRRGSVPTWSRTSVRRSRSIASRKKGVCSHRIPRGTDCFREPPHVGVLALPGVARSAAEVDRASPDRLAFVGDHADQIDRHEVLERARHGVQHARQVAARVRRLRHGQERLVLRLSRPPTVLHRRSNDLPVAKMTDDASIRSGDRFRSRSRPFISIVLDLCVAPSPSRPPGHPGPLAGAPEDDQIVGDHAEPHPPLHTREPRQRHRRSSFRRFRALIRPLTRPRSGWAACISPREVTNPNSRPDATHESASAETILPRRRRRWDSACRAALRLYVGRARARGFVVVVSQRGW